MYSPTPIIWPLLRSLAIFLRLPEARPRLRPALLTLVTPFQIFSAGTAIKTQDLSVTINYNQMILIPQK